MLVPQRDLSRKRRLWCGSRGADVLRQARWRTDPCGMCHDCRTCQGSKSLLPAKESSESVGEAGIRPQKDVRRRIHHPGSIRRSPQRRAEFGSSRGPFPAAAREFVEHVRRYVVQKYGEDTLNKEGLQINTIWHPEMGSGSYGRKKSGILEIRLCLTTGSNYSYSGSPQPRARARHCPACPDGSCSRTKTVSPCRILVSFPSFQHTRLNKKR